MPFYLADGHFRRKRFGIAASIFRDLLASLEQAFQVRVIAANQNPVFVEMFLPHFLASSKTSTASAQRFSKYVTNPPKSARPGPSVAIIWKTVPPSVRFS